MILYALNLERFNVSIVFSIKFLQGNVCIAVSNFVSHRVIHSMLIIFVPQPRTIVHKQLMDRSHLLSEEPSNDTVVHFACKNRPIFNSVTGWVARGRAGTDSKDACNSKYTQLYFVSTLITHFLRSKWITRILTNLITFCVWYAHHVQHQLCRLLLPRSFLGSSFIFSIHFISYTLKSEFSLFSTYLLVSSLCKDRLKIGPLFLKGNQSCTKARLQNHHCAGGASLFVLIPKWDPSV